MRNRRAGRLQRRGWGLPHQIAFLLRSRIRVTRPRAPPQPERPGASSAPSARTTRNHCSANPRGREFVRSTMFRVVRSQAAARPSSDVSSPLPSTLPCTFTSGGTCHSRHCALRRPPGSKRAAHNARVWQSTGSAPRVRRRSTEAGRRSPEQRGHLVPVPHMTTLLGRRWATPPLARPSHQVSLRGRRGAVHSWTFSSSGAEAYCRYVEHPEMRKSSWVLCIVVRSRKLVRRSG